MKVFTYILSLIVFCAISYQLGFNRQNIIVHEEIRGHNDSEIKFLELKCRIMEEKVAKIEKDNKRMLDFMTGVGIDLP